MTLMKGVFSPVLGRPTATTPRSMTGYSLPWFWINTLISPEHNESVFALHTGVMAGKGSRDIPTRGAQGQGGQGTPGDAGDLHTCCPSPAPHAPIIDGGPDSGDLGPLGAECAPSPGDHRGHGSVGGQGVRAQEGQGCLCWVKALCGTCRNNSPGEERASEAGARWL